MNAPLLISGPSGVGKSYLAKHLQLNYKCKRIVPVTTRAKRPNEVNGVDYQFVADEAYQNLIAENALFMNNEMLGAKYGFRKESVDSIIHSGMMPVSEIYTPKITQFLEGYPDSNCIFLMPPSIDFLVQRMRRRGETEDTMHKRIIESRKEVMLFTETYSDFYTKVYQVNENNFKEIVNDIIDNFMAEGRIAGEGNDTFDRYRLL